MNVRCESLGEVRLLRFEGGEALDAGSAPEAKGEALAAIRGGTHDVAIDLSGVEYVDSAGLGVLVSLYKATRAANRRATIFGVRPNVLRVMRLIRLDEIFDLRDDREAALESLLD